jgi:short-subunit dehydrogenase
MPPPRPLKGLRALVTGASSGIGATVSRLLLEAGAFVVGTGRDGAALDQLPFTACICRDLCEPGAPAEVVKEAVQALEGRLDLLVSNAGAGWTGPYEGTPADELDHLLDINLRVPMHLARASGPFLLESPAGGQLVLVGSIAGMLGVADEAAYAAAKSGLRGLADSLRAEWAGNKPPGPHPCTRPVTVSLVSPGPVDTAFFARRNQPYQRSWPKPMPVDKVAARIMDAIGHRLPDVVVPSWLGLAVRINGGAPSLYRRLGYLQQKLGT